MTIEAQLRSWFDANIQPNKTMLWISAVAPDTFQGNPRFLTELLKRPLEHPDAMGRRRASARYGTCLIAQAIKLLNPDPPTLISLLQEFNFFRQPDAILRKTPSEELTAKILHLIDQAFEPTQIWQKQLLQITQHFHEKQKQLRTLFSIQRGKIPSPSISSYFTSNQEWWGITQHFTENVLNVLPPFLFLPQLLNPLLIREAVRILLPTSFRNAFDVQEFANILVTKFLDKPQRHLWSQIRWGDQQLGPTHQKWIVQIASLTPQILQQKRLPQLLRRLKTIDRTTLEVTTGAFTILAQQELIKTLKPFVVTNTQKEILLALAQNPTISERQLAKDTKLARGTINRNLTRLYNQLGLSVQGEINYPKIGLQPLLLTARTTQNSERALSNLYDLGLQLQSFPYCTRLHAPTTCRDSILYATLTLPSNTISDFTGHLTKLMHQTNITSQLAKIAQFDWGWYLPYWNQFPRDEWRIYATSILNKLNNRQSFYTSIRYQGPAIRLTRETLRIILTLQDNLRLSQRQLAKKAQTSVTTATNYYNRLYHKILSPFVGLKRSPLQEVLMITISSRSSQLDPQILTNLRLFPAYQIWHLSPITKSDSEWNQSMLITASFPQGGLTPALITFDDIVNQQDATISIPVISNTILPQIHRVPIALFQTVGQEWVCPSTLLESLFQP